MTHQPLPPSQPTHNLFAFFIKNKINVRVTSLSGDVVTGRIAWFDLMGFHLIAVDNSNYFYTRKNIQSIEWG